MAQRCPLVHPFGTHIYEVTLIGGLGNSTSYGYNENAVGVFFHSRRSHRYERRVGAVEFISNELVALGWQIFLYSPHSNSTSTPGK